MKRLIFISLLLCTASALAQHTYYIANGAGVTCSDANNSSSTPPTAQSKTTPWCAAPGMSAATGNAASYTPSAGDNIVLRGCDTWTFSGQWNIKSSGSSGNLISYGGLDQTWYNTSVCPSAWNRPIISGGGTWPGGTSASAFETNGKSYLNVEWMEITALEYSGAQATAIDLSSGTNINVFDNYIHGWQVGTVNTSAEFFGIFRQIGNNNDQIQVYLNIVDGSDATSNARASSCEICTYINGPLPGGSVYENYMAYSNGCFINGPQSFHDNTLVNCGLNPASGSGQHNNIFESNTDRTAMTYYNNFTIHGNTGNAANTAQNQLAPESGTTSYGFNNVIADSNPNASHNLMCESALSNPGGTCYFFNNTVEGGADTAGNDANGGGTPGAGSPPFNSIGVSQGTGVHTTLANNHSISSCSASGCFDTATGGAINTPILTPITQTQSTANGQGYSLGQTYPFSPTTGGSTIGAGTNESSLCSTIAALDSAAGTACGKDTTLGVSYNTSNHTLSFPARTPNARPSSGAWDVGAYEFSGSSTFTVSVTVTGPGSISDSAGAIVNCTSTGGPACSGSVASGTVDTMTPTDTLGYYLSAWGGACSGNTCAPTITAATSVTATFSQSTACISTAAISPPSTSPFCGLNSSSSGCSQTGAGTIVLDPEPISGGNNTGCFHSPITRLSDGNTSTTACTNQGTSCPTQAYASVATDESDGQDNNWSLDDSQFSGVNDDGNFLFFNFNPTTMALGTVYTTSVGTGYTWNTQPVYSHVVSQKIYEFANSLGLGQGPVMASFRTNIAPPWTRTTVYDFSSSANGLPVVSATVNTTNSASGSCTADCAIATSGTFPVPVTATINGTAYSVVRVFSSTLMEVSTAPGTQTGVAYSLVWTNNLWASTGQVNTTNSASGSCPSNCVTYNGTGTNFAGPKSATINGTSYPISAVISSTLYQLGSPPGTQTGVSFVLNWVETDAPSINTTDTIFGTGFNFSGTQNSAAWVCEYVLTLGVSCFNSITSQVTGDWGSVGTATCTNCSPLGTFVIHNVKFSPDGKWAFIQQGSSCITTCSFNGDPYVWQVGTLNIQACVSDCSGHWLPGYIGWQTQYSSPFYSWQTYASPSSATPFPSTYCSGHTTPFDAHASYWWDNSIDSVPFLTSTTTATTTNPTYSFCTVSEIIGIYTPANTANSGTILRYMHNFGNAATEFATHNELMTVSQTGRFAAFTSPMAVPGSSTPYLGSLGGTDGSYPSGTVALSRGDVFVVMLNPAPAVAPAFMPVSGTYTGTQSVAITSTSPSAIVCWNTTGSPQTNGTTGCSTGTVYTGAVTVSSSEILYAVAGGTGYLDSQIAPSAYTINPTGATMHQLTPGASITSGAKIVQ